jgi:thiamine biosynthesis lipoprotein ApbE
MHRSWQRWMADSVQAFEEQISACNVQDSAAQVEQNRSSARYLGTPMTNLNPDDDEELKFWQALAAALDHMDALRERINELHPDADLARLTEKTYQAVHRFFIELHSGPLRDTRPK